PVLRPTSSPMNSIGASSRSPSPITTVPWIGSLLSSRRMASTAAWSAAFSLPRPRKRAADTAARSVTRTISSERMRSSIWCAWTVMVDMFPPWRRTLVLLNPDNLRRARYHPVPLDRRKGLAHSILGRRIGDEDDGDRPRGLCRRIAALRPGVPLHDRFERNPLLGEPARNGGGAARP